MNGITHPEQTRVTVAYVNDPKPGKKLGSIKTSDGVYFSVQPRMLEQFEQGRDYDIDYTESNGFRHVQVVKPVRETPNGDFTVIDKTSAPKTKAQDWYKQTSPRDSERMFVAKVLGDFIATGRVDFNEAMLVDCVTVLRKVYKQTFGVEDK